MSMWGRWTSQAARCARPLDAAFAVHPTLRGYVLDDQGHIRKHMVLFIDDRPVLDRARNLSNVVAANSEVWIFQALSGGSRA